MAKSFPTSVQWLIGGIALCSLSIYLLSVFKDDRSSPTFEGAAPKKAVVLAQVRQGITDINQALPKSLDEDTELVSVNLVGESVVNRHVISARAIAKLTEDSIRKTIGPQVTRRVCENPTQSALLGAGVKVRMEYLSQANIPLFDVTIDADSCTTKPH